MIQVLTFKVSPQTIIGRNFIVVFPAESAPSGVLGAEQTFVDSGAINTAVGELIDDPIARPVVVNR
jgi:hypothetical protein